MVFIKSENNPDYLFLPSLSKARGMSIGSIPDSIGIITATDVNQFRPAWRWQEPGEYAACCRSSGPAGSTDEGRGMCEIVYKMAPKARNSVLPPPLSVNRVSRITFVPWPLCPVLKYLLQSIDKGSKADTDQLMTLVTATNPFFEDGLIGGTRSTMCSDAWRELLLLRWTIWQVMTTH